MKTLITNSLITGFAIMIHYSNFSTEANRKYNLIECRYSDKEVKRKTTRTRKRNRR